jgi:hypothetical protein
VKLRVLETHLALFSRQGIIQLDHLMTNIKLSGSEIDAMFLAVQELEPGEKRELIVLCEAKSRRDDVLPGQILGEVRAAFGMGIEQDLILPMAAKAIAPSEVWVIEFEAVSREQIETTETLTFATSAIYVLTPAVPGIGR